jgi:uncharacterized membrane protein
VEAIQQKVGKISSFRMSRFQLMCALLALVFATAGLAKLQRFSEFEDTLLASRLVPLGWVRLAATALIVLELAVAASLFVPRTRTTALQTAALLICVFIGYSAWRWWRDIPIPCHCFGALFTLAPWQALLLNIGLLGLTTGLLAQADDVAARRTAAAVSAPDSAARQRAWATSVPSNESYVTQEEPLS